MISRVWLWSLMLVFATQSVPAQDKFYPVNDDGNYDVTFEFDVSRGCSLPFVANPNGSPVLVFGDQPSSSDTASFAVLAFDTQSWSPSSYTLYMTNRWPDDPLPTSLGKVVIEARNFDEPLAGRLDSSRANAYLDGYTEIARLSPSALFDPLGVPLDSYVSSMLQDSNRGRYMYLRLRFEQCTDGDDEYDTLGIVNLPSEPDRVYIAGAAGAVLVDGTLAGSWYDPARDGEGFLLDIAPDNDGNPLLAAYYFTYKNDGSGQPLWIVGAGPITGSETTLNMITASGAHFGDAFRPSDVNRQNWGTITFKFVSCNRIEVRYDSSSYGSGSFSLQRIINVPVGATGVCAP